MKQYIGFMDETGVLSNDPNQRYFALGLLKLENTSSFYESIKIIRDNAIRETGKSNFEFKFSGITKGNIIYYKALINKCLNTDEFYFSSIILDKTHKDFDTNSLFKSTWDAQLSFASLLVKNNTNGNHISIIADYLTKPKSSNKIFELELRKVPNVNNACMMESDASLFIQVVDIFIGSIVYKYKISAGISKSNTPKAELSQYLESILTDKSSKSNYNDTLTGNFTINKPFYFSCWEFKPQVVKK